MKQKMDCGQNMIPEKCAGPGGPEGDRVLVGQTWKEASTMRECFKAKPMGFNHGPEGGCEGIETPRALVWF